MSDRKGLGKRQKRILERLEQGERLFFKTYTKGSFGRTISLRASQRAWWGNGGGDESCNSIEGLVWRKLIKPKEGEMPSVGLCSPNTKVELVVSESTSEP
jgi:hypothetical protein